MYACMHQCCCMVIICILLLGLSMSAAALGVIFLFFPLHILLPIRMLNVVLSPPINYILIGGESFPRLPPAPSHSERSK